MDRQAELDANRQDWLSQFNLTEEHVRHDERGAYVELPGIGGQVNRVSLPPKLRESAFNRDANEDKPWTEMDLGDLKASHAIGDEIEQAASFLCRRIGEVRDKATEIGLKFVRQLGGGRYPR